jgi:hypothetical protein
LERGRKEINAKEKEKDLRAKVEIEYPQQRKTILKIILYYIKNNIKLNNIIFNVCYSE